MWFAYVENSMAWYDIDVADVKKMISTNRKGNKAAPLEDLKSYSADDKVETVDLIQENNLDRFEKKNKSRNRNRGNNNQQQPNNRPQNNNSEKRVENKVDNRVERTNKEEKNTPEQKPQKKFFKNKKKFPPKKKE